MTETKLTLELAMREVLGIVDRRQVELSEQKRLSTHPAPAGTIYLATQGNGEMHLSLGISRETKATPRTFILRVASGNPMMKGSDTAKFAVELTFTESTGWKLRNSGAVHRDITKYFRGYKEEEATMDFQRGMAMADRLIRSYVSQ